LATELPARPQARIAVTKPEAWCEGRDDVLDDVFGTDAPGVKEARVARLQSPYREPNEGSDP